MPDPKTPEAWQEAVDLAEACLTLWQARKLRLITRGPAVDQKRCEELLRQGREHGYLPRPGAADRLIDSLKYWVKNEEEIDINS